jgi:hypothetical protein
VGQHVVAVLQFDAEHGIRERLDDRALEHDRVFFGLGQDALLDENRASALLSELLGELFVDLRTDRLAMLSGREPFANGGVRHIFGHICYRELSAGSPPATAIGA